MNTRTIKSIATTGAPDSYQRVAFGRWLREQRESRGLTQEEAARAINIKSRLLSQREAGLKRCTSKPEDILRAWDQVQKHKPVMVTRKQLREAMTFTGLSMQGLSKALGKGRGAVARYLRDNVTITVTSPELTGVVMAHIERVTNGRLGRVG